MNKIVSFFGDKSPDFIGLNAKAEKYAKEKGLNYLWVPQNPFDQDDVISHLKESDVGIIDIESYGEEIFKEIKDRCKLLIRFGVGYDKVDLDAASRAGISISRTTGANTLGVAEMAFAMIMNLRRKFNQAQLAVKKGIWEKEIVHETIGCTLGIVGFGAIGRALAELFKGFNCNIIAYDPYPDKEKMNSMGVSAVSLEKLFEESDAISLHLPYLKETHHLIDSRLLRLMKKDSVIVNTARGNIIDEEALYEILVERKIAGAGLDVFSQEPLPLSSKLLTLDNVLLTPHLSSQTYESLWRIYEMAIDIASDYIKGNGVRNLLNSDPATL